MEKKNGLIKLLIICFCTVAICLTSAYLYKKYMAVKLDTPVIKGQIPEITYENLEDYLIEHEDFYLYIEVANDDNSRKLETKLFNTLSKYSKENDTIYINIAGVKDKKNLYKEINKKYSNGYKLSNYTALIEFKDKKIHNIVERNDSYLSIKDIDNFLKEDVVDD